MTEKTLDWLNHNRFRAYPFIDDGGLVYNKARIPDCVLLDCLVTDTRRLGTVPDLVFTEIDVTAERTRVTFSYNGESHSVEFGEDQAGYGGSGSFTKIEGHLEVAPGEELLYMSFVFSSHPYILENVGTGRWTFNGRVFPTKVVSVTASGVMGISAKGSYLVDGYGDAGVAYGTVRLVDGYRTQPCIHNGKVVVRVGNAYGENPCHYPGYVAVSNEYNCDDLMLFFCGQHAGDDGNVVLQGGPGANVKSGGTYTAKRDIIDTYGEIGIAEGESVPCIEIMATTSLMSLYRPSEGTPSEKSPA